MFIPLITIILSAAHIFGASAEQQPPNEQEAPTKEWNVLLFSEHELPEGPQLSDTLLNNGNYMRMQDPRGPQEFQSAVEDALSCLPVMAHIVWRCFSNNVGHQKYFDELRARHLLQGNRVHPVVEALFSSVVTYGEEGKAHEIALWNPFTHKRISPPVGLEASINDKNVREHRILSVSGIGFQSVRGRIVIIGESSSITARCVIQ